MASRATDHVDSSSEFNEADARLAAIVENSDDAIIGEDLDGTITSWNQGAARIFGYTADVVIGRPIAILLPPGEADEIPRILEIIREGGSVSHYETRRQRKNGQIIDVSLTVSPVRNRTGEIIGASKIARDITGQKNVQQELRDSEERFRLTFEQAAIGIAHVGLDGRWLRVNRRLCEIVGYTREELSLRNLASITHPDDLGGDLADVQAMLEGRIATYTREKRYLRPDGSFVWADLTVSLVRSESGQPRYFISVVQDITSRRAAELALARQADLLDQAQEPIFAWDLGGGITYWNRAAEELYGYRAAEAIGKCSHDLLAAVLPASAEEFERRLGYTGYWSGELTHTTKDRRVIIVESRQKVVREEGLLRVVESNRDITERKRAERQLSDLNATLELRVRERTRQLDGANSELEAFAYSVSHDLRAPLRSIDGFGRILLRDSQGNGLNEGALGYLHKMVDAAGRMSNLIQDLLNLSRISRSELKRDRVDMSEVARSIAAELSSRLPERKMDFVIESGLIVQADARLLRVALENLLENAYKFTGKQELARIVFGSTQKDGRTVYFIQDNGAGFSMEYATKLFTPFHRLHRSDEFEGTGIGLAIVNRVIHKHGGTISASAKVGSGATFSFTLG